MPEIFTQTLSENKSYRMMKFTEICLYVSNVIVRDLAPCLFIKDEFTPRVYSDLGK